MSKRARDDQQARLEVAHAIEIVCGKGVRRERDAVEDENSKPPSLTPLEKQVVALKETIPAHVVLLVACGYRVTFYGRDSHVISRRTGIACIQGYPFEHSSIPYTRVEFYIHRLVGMGYHVAFADQESAAVRAVEGAKTGIFTRSISQVYSRGTLLPGEKVQTNGSLAAEAARSGAQSSSTAASSEAAPEEGPEVPGEDLEPALNAPTHPSSTSVSEALLMFLYCQKDDSSDTGSAGRLEIVLVSFVTHRRIVLTMGASQTLSIEDVLQRYDIAEVILLVSPENTVSHGNNASRKEDSSTFRVADLLKKLPENITTLLYRMLPLQLGPSLTGEEDGGSVSVSYGWKDANTSVDDAIMAYLQPYQLSNVYYRLLQASLTSPMTEGERAAGAPSSSDSIKNHQAASPSPPQETMNLHGSSLRALELFHSSTGTRGSLFRLLNATMTANGARQLRQWLSAPLVRYADVMERQTAVSFLVRGSDGGLVEEMLREAVKGGGSDMEGVLGRMRALRCPVRDFIRFLRVLQALSSLASQLTREANEEGTTLPAYLNGLVERIHSPLIESWLLANKKLLRSTAATPYELFTGGELPKPPPTAVQEHIDAAKAAEKRLDDELQAIRVQLGMPDLEYRTIGGTPYLIDITHAKADRFAGKDWTVCTRTKTNVRYQTPKSIEANIALCAANERIIGASRQAWIDFQETFFTEGGEALADSLVTAVKAVACLDALHSLAVTSRRQGYTAPVLVDLERNAEQDPCGTGGYSPPAIEVVQGRHPVADELLQHRYVSCNVSLRWGHTFLLTGPNMGGKSAFMRLVGVFVVLAQVGCYVPAEAARLPLFSGIYCRMGASDSVLDGRSTFMSEMEETSRILSQPDLGRSLVLMDELGRGTSSFDGVAVAAATLEYLVQQRATSIFVTHYTNLCEPYINTFSEEEEVSSPFPKGLEHDHQRVECFFMGYREEAVNTERANPEKRCSDDVAEGESVSADQPPPEKRVVFTYLPCPGVAPSSFGVQVAKMAGLTRAVTDEASLVSKRTENMYQVTRDMAQLFQLVTKE